MRYTTFKKEVNGKILELIQPIPPCCSFYIREDKEDKIIELGDEQGHYPTKKHLVLIRDYINELLQKKDLEPIIKVHNENLDKRGKQEEQKTNSIKRNIKPGHIYFLLTSSQKIKIGRTANLSTRLSNLITHHPEKPTLFHSFKTEDTIKSEKELHNKYQQYRLNGEWFNIPQEELEKIKETYL